MNKQHRVVRAVLLGALLAMPALLIAAPLPTGKPGSIERGRYLVKISGCNDCHTPGYAQRDGQVPERDWLTGDSLGWSGPWGTTYASNLRLKLAALSEAQWLHLARTARYRPPMPWFNLHAMSEGDLRAVYRYVRHLGPAGVAAPAYVPPGGAVATAVVRFPGPPPAQ
ncbi:MAG: cytochrome C [Proteobacteria bacterium]|nr:cytochrome C [Pseudomonadota bacterium]